MLRRRRSIKVRRSLEVHGVTASTSVPSYRLRLGIPRLERPSRATQSRVDDQAIGKCSPSGTVGLKPWYQLGSVKSGKRSEMGLQHPTSGLSTLQKQGTNPRDQEVTIRESDSQGVPVLPPAHPTNNPQAFSDIRNMGRGSLLSRVGDNSSKHDHQWSPRRSSRQSRVASSGSEQNSTEATHRRDTAANVSNLQRLTEHS